MGKAPADQFYWADWLRDVELQLASTSSRGIWANALCHMWFAKARGELEGTREKLALLCNCKLDEFDQFWNEAEALGFCYTKRNPNGLLTVRNRRMYRKAKEQENNRLRQQRYYEKHKDDPQPNANIPPPSSSSSPSSSSILKKETHIKKEKHTPSPIKLPEWFKQKDWDIFVSHRKAIKSPVTNEMRESFIKKFEKLKEQGWTPDVVIGTMIEKGWRWFKPEWLEKDRRGPQFLSEKGQRTLDNVKDVKFGGEGADD